MLPLASLEQTQRIPVNMSIKPNQRCAVQTTAAKLQVYTLVLKDGHVEAVRHVVILHEAKDIVIDVTGVLDLHNKVSKQVILDDYCPRRLW